MAQSLQTPAERHNARAAREGWPSQCDDSLAFANPKLKDLPTIWQQVRGSRVLPMRTDFTARALVRHLREVMFLERTPTARYRFGYYGSGVAQYSGDFTGKHLDEVVPAEFLPAWMLAFDTVLDHGAPLRYVSVHRSFKLDYLTAESFAAPLGDAGGLPTGLLAAIVYTPRVT